MNQNKKRQYESQIIKLLLNSKQTSVKAISEKIKLSNKTVRLYIDEINECLIENNLGSIVKKRGIGIYLLIEQSKYKLVEGLFNCETKDIVNISQFDAKVILKILLKLRQDDYVTKLQLANLTFESIPKLNNTLKHVQNWLNEFDIEIKAKRGSGLFLIGNEFARRQAIKTFIMGCNTDEYLSSLKVFAEGVNVKQVLDVIRKSEKEWHIQFTNRSFRIIGVMVCVALARVRYPIRNMDVVLNKTEFYNEYNFSDTIFKFLKESGYVNFHASDIKLIALEIIMASKIKWDHSPKIKSQIHRQTKFDDDLVAFVDKLIQLVSSILRVSLTNDDQLRDGLIQHLRSAIFRVKYGRNIRHTNNLAIKSKYKNIYLSVLATSPLFEEYYGIQITEDEIDFIVLYVKAALLRKKDKIDVTLITNLGRAQRMLTVEMIKHYIPQINEVDIISSNTFSTLIQTANKKTLFLSNESDVNNDSVLSINEIPNNQDLDNIKNRIDDLDYRVISGQLFSKESQSLFNMNLIDPNLEITNKKMLLKSMVDKMEQAGKVSPGFFDSIWSREHATATSIGNMCAIPHGDMNLVNDPCVGIMTLKRPIQWFDEDDLVQTVFVLAAKMNNQFEINRTRRFFQDLISFTEDPRLQKQLLSKNEKTVFYDFLIG